MTSTLLQQAVEALTAVRHDKSFCCLKEECTQAVVLKVLPILESSLQQQPEPVAWQDFGLAAAWNVLQDNTIPASSRYIRAIKAHRVACGSGLKEAKDAVDGLQYGYLPPPALWPREPAGAPGATDAEGAAPGVPAAPSLAGLADYLRLMAYSQSAPETLGRWADEVERIAGVALPDGGQQ